MIKFAILLASLALVASTEAKADPYLHKSNAYVGCQNNTYDAAASVIKSYKRKYRLSPVGPGIYYWQRFSRTHVYIELQYHEWKRPPYLAVNYACWIDSNDLGNTFPSSGLKSIGQSAPYWVR